MLSGAILTHLARDANHTSTLCSGSLNLAGWCSNSPVRQVSTFLVASKARLNVSPQLESGRVKAVSSLERVERQQCKASFGSASTKTVIASFFFITPVIITRHRCRLVKTKQYLFYWFTISTASSKELREATSAK
jgi:hypothetical protein